MPDSEGKTLADTASTWMQVVFAGLGVGIATVALVFAYFAWVQPHSPDDTDDAANHVPATITGTGPAATATTATATTATGSAVSGPPASAVDTNPAAVSLTRLTPAIGSANIHRSGDDLVLPCATGQSTDRLRTVEYDVSGRYTAMETEVRVSKARDDDTLLQLEIFADGPEAANQTLTKGKTARVRIPLDGTQKMRLQLTCQSPDGEITLRRPNLIHP